MTCLHNFPPIIYSPNFLKINETLILDKVYPYIDILNFYVRIIEFIYSNQNKYKDKYNGSLG